MLREIRPAIVVLVALTLITGLVYPLAMTGIAEVIFPRQAQGQPDRARRQGRRLRADRPGVHERQILSRPPVGDHRARSQRRDQDHPRPVQRREFGRVEPRALQQGADRPRAERHRGAEEGEPAAAVPADLVTTSASGLDPHISPEAALFQVPRIAKARNMPEDRIRQLVEDNAEGRFLGLLGEPRVNVLLLNLALDRMPAG